MRLLDLNLENFRNITLGTVALEGRDAFLSGANAQGKTNFLEAVGFVTAGRSFRTQNHRPMIREGQAQARLFYRIQRDSGLVSEVLVELQASGKAVFIDGHRRERLSDFIGEFPTVTFCSEDIHLIREGPAARRKWLDLMLSSVDADYLKALTDYHRGIKDRNRLLKEGKPIRELSAFEYPLSESAHRIYTRRSRALLRVSALAAECFGHISSSRETLEMAYRPDVACNLPESLYAEFDKTRDRDRQTGVTQSGPHRDDLECLLSGRSPRAYASEGQQRSLVLALKLAQLRYVEGITGTIPLLLADDVLGELDPVRHQQFWGAVPPQVQVIATGTRQPLGDFRKWRMIDVCEGGFSLRRED